ncbi:MAG: class I SAM-dependent methyltransferase [Finegoldia sp.]|uniref:class I SAM-dependent methyltransferase n=1 Tax=Finegoldia sp. TaxID=1981334 RepID=UPI0039930B9A
MSKFYDSISDNYEDIFQPNDKQINFLEEHAHGKILDVACATGKVAKRLQDDGYDVMGIDLEEKFVDKAINENKIDAKCMNMLDIDKLRENFGLIYCIGNSLVHLDSTEKINEFLKKCYDKLNPNGNHVLQIINFHPFLQVDDDYLGNLPTIKNEKVEFVRKYFRNGDFIRFNTVMTAADKSIENDVNLFPITSDELVKLLEQNGFEKIKIYGGFNKAEFDKEKSRPLVISAEKL